jgi:patatin-like phospholipase/acyl hydrolase
MPQIESEAEQLDHAGEAAATERSSRRFQILSLDGGGYKGVFSVAVLARLEEDLGVRLLDHFDLIAGTSTGGIIALGLGAGLSAQDILDFYLRYGTQIFPKGRWRTTRQLVRSKYKSAPLRRAVDEIFENLCLWNSKVPLCIPAYDLESDDVHLFRTPHTEKLTRDWRHRMADIAMATSAAPTYLRAHEMDDLRLVDGGVWANNPTTVALVEAVSVFGIDLADIRIMSVGTTSDLEENKDRLNRGGLLQWATSTTTLILRGQNRAAENVAFLLVPEGQFLRINPKVPADVLRLDGVDPGKLRKRAAHESRNHSPAVKQMFLDHHAGPYAPLHTPDKAPT